MDPISALFATAAPAVAGGIGEIAGAPAVGALAGPLATATGGASTAALPAAAAGMADVLKPVSQALSIGNQLKGLIPSGGGMGGGGGQSGGSQPMTLPPPPGLPFAGANSGQGYVPTAIRLADIFGGRR